MTAAQQGAYVDRPVRNIRLYVGSVLLLSCLAIGISWSVQGPRRWPSVVVLALLCMVGEWARVRRVSAETNMTTNSIVMLASIVIVGPSAAMLVPLLPGLFDLRRGPTTKSLFNVGLFVLMTAGAGLTYYQLGGSRDVAGLGDPTALLTHVALPLVAANVVMCLINAVLLTGALSVAEGEPPREVLTRILRSGGVAYVGYGLFGLLLVVLWDAAGVGPLSALLVLAPLFVARWAFAQYAAEHAAHERTVAALVQAVEAKDHYTRGHSERVARASVIIARAIGISQHRTSTLHFAGMLHDVGKLGVPTRILQKAGALTDEEFAAIARHPVRGLEMVREIAFLGEAFEGILHHHERMDGRGYPMGLAGEAIPEFARIISVADAFDSMTSTRSYRQARTVEEAIDELRRCSGTQFAPELVEALVHGLARTPWAATGAIASQVALSDAGCHTDGTAREQAAPSWYPADSLDHDDPAFDEARLQRLDGAVVVAATSTSAPPPPAGQR